MPELRPVVAALMGVVLIALADPYSILAGLLMLVLGIFVGASLPPEYPAPRTIPVALLEWLDAQLPHGPVATLQRRQPWTEPGFSSW